MAVEQLALIAAARSERERWITFYETNHGSYLKAVRAAARDIAQRDGTVDIDKVRVEMDRRCIPMPAEFGASNRLLGALFTKSEFIAVGQHLTTRAERIARAGSGSSFICVYRLKNVAA
jgi:hypothetical protein